MIKYPFKVFQTEVEGRVFWIANSSYLKGCVGQGDDISEALSEFEELQVFIQLNRNGVELLCAACKNIDRGVEFLHGSGSLFGGSCVLFGDR